MVAGLLLKSHLQLVGMKLLSERDENVISITADSGLSLNVGMKPLSERDENFTFFDTGFASAAGRRNEATL